MRDPSKHVMPEMKIIVYKMDQKLVSLMWNALIKINLEIVEDQKLLIVHLK